MHTHNDTAVPLVVDLDHTLARTDVAMEALVAVASRSPLLLLRTIAAMRAGRSTAKAWLARQAPVHAPSLPYNAAVLALIHEARAQNRPVVLATAAHWRTAHRVAAHLALFDDVIASAGKANRKGQAKLAELQARYSATGFDYVGDARVDRPIWQAARVAYTVGVPTQTANQHRLEARPSLARAALGALRAGPWAVSAIAFAPWLLRGGPSAPGGLHALVAFVALGALGMGAALLGDVVAIPADRLHPRRRLRPLAAGTLPIPVAVALAALAIIAGLGLALAGGGLATGRVSLAYLALALLRAKAGPWLGGVALAGLGALAVVAGALG